MRVVLDPNVIISAMLSPGGTPAKVFGHWRSGVFDLVVSPTLVEELEGVLGREKFQGLIHLDEVAQLMSVLNLDANMFSDPAGAPEVRSIDPNDDYLIALASLSRSVLVSGDKDLLELADRIPVYSPAELLALIGDTTTTPGSSTPPGSKTGQ